LRLLIEELEALRSGMLAAERRRADDIDRVHPSYRRSATNLVHYMELRRHDVRQIQDRLGALGLSTLGRAEAHVLATVEAVLATLHRLAGTTPPSRDDHAVSYEEGERLLRRHTDDLLGPAPQGRWTRIMVTLPTEAADDAGLVRRLRACGMDVARINCAHDDAATWRRMAVHVREAAAQAGRPSRIAMDLAGPKLRTGPLEAGPKVRKLRPRRGVDGSVIEPWRADLATGATAAGVTGAENGAIPVEDAAWLARRSPGERISLTDARGSRRVLVVTGVGADRVHVEGAKTTYFATGTAIVAEHGDDPAVVGELPPIELALRLHVGDILSLTADLSPAEVGTGSTHCIGCTLPEVFKDVQPGQRVLFDDGRIHGVARTATPGSVDVEIVRAGPKGTKLRGGKGINLPDTDLSVRALTPKDAEDLETARDVADAVQASFVQSAADVQDIIDRLQVLDAMHLGLILKIETVRAFERLPDLLLTAMQEERVGVMIARGDLAVEAGFERLAEVQEEILWLCEAAHVPVVWATEVLDSLAKTGQPSRAEVTDAAMGQRAECVMLNKGPAIDEAIRALSDILGRMADHQRKKRTLLRRLHAWDRGTT
jgi:pyruvate kinase